MSKPISTLPVVTEISSGDAVPIVHNGTTSQIDPSVWALKTISLLSTDYFYAGNKIIPRKRDVEGIHVYSTVTHSWLPNPHYYSIYKGTPLEGSWIVVDCIFSGIPNKYIVTCRRQV